MQKRLERLRVVSTLGIQRLLGVSSTGNSEAIRKAAPRLESRNIQRCCTLWTTAVENLEDSRRVGQEERRASKNCSQFRWQSTQVPRQIQEAEDDRFLQHIEATSGPAAHYKENRLSGLYKKDLKQESTVLKLQQLYDELRAYLKGKPRRSGLTLVDHTDTSKGHHAWWQGISTFLGDRRNQAGKQCRKVQGLYMYGGVGTGKTMLMDLLVDSAPPQFKLRRLHFHDFMLEIHGMLRQYANQQDPLNQVGKASAAKMKVLCLDELFVTDVADAAILNRLFGSMWDQGVTLVATSNRLKKETEVHDMASPVDYRRLAHHRKGLYFSPRDSKDPDEELTAHFASLADTAGGQPPEPRQISVQMGRKLNIPLAGAHMCLMTFHELCSKNLGAADYIALAGEFHSVALRGVPCFDSRNKPEAYRFVTLIDVLYEHRIRVFCSAAADPHELFAKVVSQQEAKAVRDSHDLDIFVVDDNLAFSKDRTISRLIEMESREYLMSHARRHVPCLVLALEEEGGAEKSRKEEALQAATA